MTTLTIQIPDSLARGLKEIASAQNKSIELVAAERLSTTLAAKTSSPQEILRIMGQLGPVSQEAIDDLNAAIAGARLPIVDKGVFDQTH